MPVHMVSVGKKAAMNLMESKWWEGKTPREIAKFQLFVEERCCPFRVLHKAVEQSLGRRISIYEFGFNYETICMEFLKNKEKNLT